MGNAALEARLRGVLLEAGQLLAASVRAGLQARGLPPGIEALVEGNRVRIVSRSRDVFDAENGLPGAPPSAPMQCLARETAPAILKLMGAGCRRAFDE